MLLTRAADYAVRVAVYLATLPPDRRASRAELARTSEIPEHFLSKVLQRLNHAGLIRSYRGVGGGFTLARPPAETTLLAVVEAIEGPLALNLCLMTDRRCQQVDRCPVHAVWVEAQGAMADVLRRATMADLGTRAVEMRRTAWS